MFSHPVYLFLREFSLQDSRGGSLFLSVFTLRVGLSFRSGMVCSVSITLNQRVVALLNAGCRKVLPR
ncbi:hypothetical protein MZG63_22005 [Escherichia coli]|nr:hypothetical protein [Escherichia coli]